MGRGAAGEGRPGPGQDQTQRPAQLPHNQARAVRGGREPEEGGARRRGGADGVPD